MRIPEYEVYQRRSLHWAIRWSIRVVVWFVMSLVLLLGWWANYVFVNVKPFEVLHSGEHWISWEQLSPEARGFAEVRWDRPYAELARYGADWPDRHDHLLVVGLMSFYPSVLAEDQARGLILNTWLMGDIAKDLTRPPNTRMGLEEFLRCTWPTQWYTEREFDRLLKQMLAKHEFIRLSQR